MTTYIAGPMTGLPEFNFPAFNAVAEELRANGIDVRNPADNGAEPGQTWQHYMRLGLRQLLECDEILLLPNWEHSRGATLERHIAEQLGMTVTIWQAS
jgi:hypothetical protein